MKFEGKLEVDAVTFDEMEKIVDEPHEDVKKDGVEFDEEFIFSNGNRMAIQVCGPGDPSEESCWTQGVVFDPAGNELGCTDVGESFEGEYHVPVGNDEYVVNVIRKTGIEYRQR